MEKCFVCQEIKNKDVPLLKCNDFLCPQCYCKLKENRINKCPCCFKKLIRKINMF